MGAVMQLSEYFDKYKAIYNEVKELFDVE